MRLPITATIPEVRDRFVGLGVDEASGEQVGLAGRVVFSRNTGKLCFATLQAGDGSRIQAMVSLAEVGEESLADWKELVDLGDHVFVAGEVISSRRGELSIMVSEWRIASKAILPLPNLHNELSEETRVRSRYLDLIAREQARKTVIARAKVNASLRHTFDALGFIEVETPMLQVHARRRIGPPVRHELERVRHRPLSCASRPSCSSSAPSSAASSGCSRSTATSATRAPTRRTAPSSRCSRPTRPTATTTGSPTSRRSSSRTRRSPSPARTSVTWADGTEFDLGGDWARISMYDSLSEAVGEQITASTPDGVGSKQLADAEGIEIDHPLARQVRRRALGALRQGRPRAAHLRHGLPARHVSPLVREHRSIPGVVEKWDLYVRGFELATGYSELVDPVIQRERFVEQAKLAAGGDLEAMRIDEEFLRALEYGMPPSGGMGMGIDRLLMAITGLGIRETILFPLVK